MKMIPALLVMCFIASGIVIAAERSIAEIVLSDEAAKSDNQNRGRRGRGRDDGSNSNSDRPLSSDVTMEEARRIALKEVPGKVIKAEYEREHGRAVYEFYIRKSDGSVYEVYVDAGSGRIVKIESRRR